MVASRLILLLGYPSAVAATECLVGCLVQGISPFDDDNLAVWDDRSACDSTTVGCEVSALRYPSSLFQGALWASTSGTDGSSACTCSICDPYLGGDTTDYMPEETSLWSRIHCYIAAAEASGYDVSPCVATIVDTGTLPCVDDVYEAPTVAQFDCGENALDDLSDSSSVEECKWDGTVRKARELFSATSTSSSTASTSAVVNSTSCLVGCLVQGISPFDDENLAVWSNRETCDSTTIGCEVSAIEYPGFLFQGALWASSWGTEGSAGCRCNLCDPYLSGDETSYMPEETSLWSRIQCYLVASEESGYDVSPCVAAIVETGMLPCVDDVYVPPTVDKFDCKENALSDLSASSSVDECKWDGTHRSTNELYEYTRAPSPPPGSTPAPAPASATSDTTLAPSPSPLSDGGPQPSIGTNSPGPTPSAKSETFPPSASGTPRPSSISTISPAPTPATPSVTFPSNPSGSTPPLEVDGGSSCAGGNTCADNLCCHPDSNTCGRSEFPPAPKMQDVKVEHLTRLLQGDLFIPAFYRPCTAE